MDIKIKDFEGPLDLLLHLVSKCQVDIYEVPITEVIEQYLDYLATLSIMRLEIAGEYMVMASQLMVIKSRKLLPKIQDEQPIEDDLEQDLLEQIQEYRRFKTLGEQLAQQHQARAQHFSKPRLELIYEEADLVFDRTVMDLFLTFSSLLSKQKETFKQSHTTVLREEYTIEEMMEKLRHWHLKKPLLCLQEVVEEVANQHEFITLFLATLELVKIQECTVVQKEPFGMIYLERKYE